MGCKFSGKLFGVAGHPRVVEAIKTRHGTFCYLVGTLTKIQLFRSPGEIHMARIGPLNEHAPTVDYGVQVRYKF